MSAPAMPSSSVESTPPWPLVADEQLLHGPHLVEYADRMGLAWLTSQRVMVRVTTPTAALSARIAAESSDEKRADLSRPQQFQLPLAMLTGHNVSAATNLAKLMLKLNYTTTSGTSISAIIRFAGGNALAERTQWKEVLVERQRQAAANSNANATANTTAVKTEPMVKKEPNVALASVPAVPAAVPAAAAAPQAASAPPPRIPPAAAAAPLRAPPGPAKRPHGAMSASPSPAAAPPNRSNAELQSLIRCRAALLARDRALQAVHTELVPNAVSEEEFWAGRTELLRAEQGRQGTGGDNATGSGVQRAGISSAMASTIRPETGCNIVRYTLDATQIHAIFLENPMVYELYQQLVPDTLDEKEFWTKYFKSQYIHSQSSTTVSTELAKNPTEDDLFAKATAMQEAKDNEAVGATISATLVNADPVAAATAAAAAEEKKDLATKALLIQRKIDPSVDLTAADITNAVLLADPTKSSGSSASSSNTTRSKKARAQTELLQRFNRHGMLVLDSNLTAARNASAAEPSTSEAKLQSTYHSSLASSLNLVDLSHEVAPTYNQLAIGRNFFQALGSRKTTSTTAESKEHNHELAARFVSELDALSTIDATNAIRHSVQHIPASSESRSILLDLTNTARGLNKAAIAAKQLRDEGQQQLIVFSTGNEPDMLIPDQFRDELKKRYHTCNELFRHFWSSLTPRTAAKLRRVHAALDEQYRLLQVIRSSLNSRNFSQLVPLLNPLVTSIEMCHSTFQRWQEKEAKRTTAGPVRRMTNAVAAQTNGGAAATPTPQMAQPVPTNAAASMTGNASSSDLERESKRVKM